MKKKLLIFVLVSTILLVGCGNKQYVNEQDTSSDLIGGRFVILEECKDLNITGNYYSTYIVYDKDTKVMYYILDGFRRAGLCPMYDTNGDVMIYNGEEK
jgi:major membrane immunogen (membrane-anchored lipoprotein)